MQPAVSETQKSKDACRFHQYERPALARGVDGPVGAGQRSEERGERVAGDGHGRLSTEGYHQRYASNAAGSSLPGSAGAAKLEPAVVTPRGDGTTAGARQVGACDPRLGNMTASVQATTACRFHASGADAAQRSARQQSQYNRMNLSSPRDGPPNRNSPRQPSSPTPVVEPATAVKSSRVDDYRDLMEARSRRATGSPPAGPARMISSGGGGMSAKGRLNESNVAAARQTSSPIACADGIWA